MNAQQGTTPTSGAPRFFAERIALVFSAPMLVNGIGLPFFPLWLSSLAFDDFQIGIVLAVPMVVRVFTAPLAGVLADRIGERAHVLVWSAVLSLMTACALFLSNSFWPVLLIYTLQGAVYAPFVPITEAIALSGVRRWNFDYGKMRYWGSLAFIAATMVGGWLSGLYGGAMVLPSMATGFVSMVLVALMAPRIGKPRRPSPISALAVGPASSLRQKDVQFMLVGAALVNASHALLFAFSVIYWETLGFTGTQIGLLWSAGVFAEVLVFVFAVQLRRRFSLWSMIIFGCAVAVARWLFYPQDVGLEGYFALQCLHAFTYASIHIGVQNRIVQRVSEDREASAQGVYFLYNGIFMAIATFVSGYAYAWYGVKAFYLMSVVAATGFAFVLLARKCQPQSLPSGGKTSEAS
ncbi:MFS transporter [Sinorhizobium sp. BG8]|uniref:MFS transporter n=1 Tax=Sinorhizobium sp. BG8 TaxID=2613773 RepID=UPI00193DFA76|nr:MFS transporter [Sinorhizobium sp. BG8]QRM55674.1 MFS transporter [Sinorhizobium sp. BG8]